MRPVALFQTAGQLGWEYTPGAIRSSVNRSTGLSPNQMMLGRKVNRPVDLVFPPVQEDKVNTATDYVARSTESIQISHEIVHVRIHTILC